MDPGQSGVTPNEIFHPQLTREEALVRAQRYNDPREAAALEAGKAIKHSDFSRDNLRAIFTWKTKDRGRSRLTKNADDEIRDALRLAVSAETPRAAVAVLRGLSGVDTPVASAILTAIFPEKYTILDFRALDALGIKTPDRSLSFYLRYLAYCNTLAGQWAMPLRDLDRALWSYRPSDKKAD